MPEDSIFSLFGKPPVVAGARPPNYIRPEAGSGLARFKPWDRKPGA